MEKKNTRLAIILVSIFGICLIGCLAIGLAIRFAPNLYEYSLENSSLQVGDVAPDFRTAHS